MSNSKKCAVQITVLSLAVSMMIMGVSRGEVATVLNKAVNICLECIGLGVIG